MRLSDARIRWSVWIACGVLLRLVFIAFPRPGDDDTGVYLELGHNLLHHGVYGMAHAGLVTPSLFRLPGYPLILALAEQAFSGIWPHGWINVVLLFQAGADLAGAFLLAAFARRFISQRAAEVTFALAALCPFTAAYAGIAMTESLSVFAISLGIYAASRAIGVAKERSPSRRIIWPLVLAGLAAALAMLLRPDGVLLFAAIGAGLFGYLAAACRRSGQGLRSAIVSTSIYCAIALLPLVPWTIRNWITFHVFQPLAPRYVNDPGERVNRGFYQWMRTWSTEYSTTDSVFWSVGSESIALSDLPARACDSPQQLDETRRLLDDYNRWNAVSPELDQRFAALAAERIRSRPLRYYLELPVLRVADMTFRPRTEPFYLDISWWLWSVHPGQTVAAVSLALINLGYFALAAWGFVRGRVPLAWMLGGYLVLRCLLLGTMENAEPRYTLECFPILIVAAAAAVSPRASRS